MNVIKEHKPTPAMVSGSPLFSFGSLVSLLIGFASIYEFNLIGRLSLQEVLVAILAPLLAFTKHERFSRVTKWLLGAVILWLLVQIFTDLVRSIPFRDMARGCARIVFFGFSLVTFSVLLKKDSTRIAMFLLGVGLSSALSYFIYPNELGYVDPWKWYFSTAVTSCAVAILCWSRLGQYSISWILILGSIGVVSALNNYRSHAAILLAAVAYFIFNKFFLKLPLVGRLGLVVAGGFSILVLYVSLASSGVLGDNAQTKLAKQYDQERGVLSIMTGGRVEYRASLQAISDSPILGYGSWAQRPEYAYLLVDDGMDSAAVEGLADAIAFGIIPTHSFLFGAWVDGGIVAATLWISIWSVCVFVLLTTNTASNWLPKLCVFLALGLVWNILFSPFGIGARVMTAFAIVIILDAWQFWAPSRVRKYFRTTPMYDGST